MLDLIVVEGFCFDIGVVNLAALVADLEKLLMGNGHRRSPQQQREPHLKSCGYRYGIEQTAITK